MTQRVPMTAAGAAKLRQKLQELKNVDRPRVIAAIAEARGHGDLSENAEYHAAREQQSFIEGRIAELEYKLSHAHIIDVTQLAPSDKVVFGATVCLTDENSGEELRYQIVGEDEADIKAGRISINSRSPGADRQARRRQNRGTDPNGVKAYEIVEVLYL